MSIYNVGQGPKGDRLWWSIYTKPACVGVRVLRPATQLEANLMQRVVDHTATHAEKEKLRELISD